MHPDQEALNDYVDHALPSDRQRALDDHLAGCVPCRTLVAELIDLKRAAAALGTIAPPPHVWPRLERAIASERAPRALTNRPFARWIGPLQAIAAAMLLAVGFLAGRHLLPASPSTTADIAGLRREIDDVRQVAMLSLIQQQSASERLKGVTFTSQIEQPGNEIAMALLDTLMHDANVNVRLATVDALRRFATRENVRRGVIDTLNRQASPLLQIALIDFLADFADRDALDVLRRLSGDPVLDPAVRGRATRALQQIG